MVRRLLQAGLCLCAAAFVGCGGNPRDSIVSNTSNLVSAVASTSEKIKESLEEYLKKKEAKDQDGAKKHLEEAINEAKSLEKTAQKLQEEASRSNSLGQLTDEEKKSLLDTHKKRINDTRAQLVEKSRELKKVIADANKAGYEDELKPFVQAMNKAQGEFAAIVRKK